MDTKGFGRMLGRGLGSLMKNVNTDEWVDTLEKKMVEGADAVKRVIDNPQAAAEKLSQQTEVLKQAFQEGYAETVNGSSKSQPSTRPNEAPKDPTSPTAEPHHPEQPSDTTKP